MEASFLKRKIAKGFLSLTFRKAVLLAINYLTINIILARILPVSTIGIFNIANSVLAFFTFFSDIGLAAALIQKKEIKQEDIKTTFTVQEILAFLITVVVWFSAPVFATFYNLDISGMWLIRSLAVSFFLVSLKVVPSVLLERDLKFHPLVFVEILETIVFNLMLVGLTLANFGVSAFAYAAILRSVTGVVVIYLIAPWKISLAVSKESLKSLLSFGLPFQANSILALLKDRLVPLVIAKMVGSLGVGYITWAQSLAFLSLEVMNIMIRVTFPAFSRLQDSKENLKSTLEDSLFATGLVLYPMLLGLNAVAPSLIAHVVSPKWQPALPLIYLFSIGAFWATLSSPFTNFLNAIGRIKITLKLMVMWTTLEWALSPLLTLYFGFLGVGIASAVISITSIIPLIIVRRLIKIEVIRNIWQPILASSVMALFAFFLSRTFVNSFITLLWVVLISAAFYFVLIFILAKERIIKYYEGIKND